MEENWGVSNREKGGKTLSTFHQSVGNLVFVAPVAFGIAF